MPRAEHEGLATLRRVNAILGVAVTLVLVLGLPLGYFLTVYDLESRRLEENGRKAAENVLRFAYLHPNTWQLQDYRLYDLLDPGPGRQQVLIGEDGETVIHAGETLSGPLLTREIPIQDGDMVIAWIHASVSVEPLYWRTGLAAVSGLALAILAYLGMRLLPFRAMESAWRKLHETQSDLQREIEEKEKTLDRLEDANTTMRQIALHDPLTGLANRALFTDRLEHTLLEAKRSGGLIACLLMDLDRFKEVNDTLGHQVGDMLLQAVAKRLVGALRESDTISRLGGDEFAMVVTPTSAEDSTAIASKLLESLSQPVQLEGQRLPISASIGIATFPTQAGDASQLLRQADVAMYTAKRGRTGYAHYDPSLDKHSRSLLQLSHDLLGAQERGELFLAYQPKVSLDNFRILGVEALARWEHPERGRVSPDVFIPIAERSGLINRLTRWSLEYALSDTAGWLAEGLEIGVAVNVSTQLLTTDELPTMVEEQLEQWSVPSRLLTLEITENSIMADPSRAKAILDRLHTQGVRISIDDFGTGYSSLSHLTRLPVDEVKIDRSFVRNLTTVREDRLIVQSTVDLGHNLGLTVVAEGVEDTDTVDTLVRLGCDLAQGRYVSFPMVAADLPALVRRPLRQYRR